MEQDIDSTAIREALDTLDKEGRKLYKPEYQEGANRYDAIGLAIARCDDTFFPENIARLAFSIWEDWNAHSACAVLDWIFPRMYHDPSLVYGHKDLIDRLQHMIGDRVVTVFTTWNAEHTDYDTAKYRVRLVVEKIETDNTPVNS